MTQRITLTVTVPAEMIDALAEAIGRKAQGITMASISDTDTSPFMTIREAADYLRCSRQRVDDLLSSRRLTRVKEGRRTLVRRAEINAYLRQQR